MSVAGQHVPGFLELLLFANVCMGMCVCVCVRPPLRLLITSGVMWHDMDSIRLVKQILLLCMATAVIIGVALELKHVVET